MRLHWTKMPSAILAMSRTAFRTVEDVETVLGIIPTDDEMKLLARFLEKSNMKVQKIGAGAKPAKDAAATPRPALSDAEEFALLLMAEVPTMLQRRMQLLHVAMSTPCLLDELDSSTELYARAIR